MTNSKSTQNAALNFEQWLDRTQAITDAATPGRWEDVTDDLTDDVGVVYDNEYVSHIASIGTKDEDNALEDARFIAHARAALPAAVAALRAVLDLHKPEAFHDEPSMHFCRTCQVASGGWPCPTITAITEAIGDSPTHA